MRLNLTFVQFRGRVFALLGGLVLSCLSSAAFAASAYPYPQAATYANGFKPTNPATGTWASDYTTLYNKYTAWRAVHVVNGGGATLRVSRNGADGFDTVSEGISYGMLMAVYFDDKVTFDGLWGYKQSKNDGLGLMNWRINSAGAVTGSNSATDADEDIAFSLFLAHRQWGSGGALNYYSLALAEVTKIRNYCLDNNRVKPGDAFNSCRYPSYFFPNEYRVFANETGDFATWGAVRTNSYNTIAAARNNTTGLIAEQTTDTGVGGGCGVSSSRYEYNSCRVPFRMALDYVYYGDSNAATHLDKVTSFFGAITPANVRDCYVVSNGTTCNGNNEGAFVGPAATAFMRTGGANLQNYYNFLMGMNHTNNYYSGAIQLLTLLLLQGNMPNIADPGAIYSPTRTNTPTPYAGTPTFTATQTPIAFAYVFEDFEAGSVKNGYPYTGPGSTMSFGASTVSSHSPTYSDRMLVTIAAASYGGHGFESNYANGQGVVDMTGSNKVRFWINTDKDLSGLRISFREGTVAGGDDEVWQSLPLNIFASPPGWKVVEVDLSTFTEDPYNGSCQALAGGCAGNGNNVFNLASVKGAQFGFNSAVAAATVYVDDIVFVPAVAPTPSFTRTPFNQPYNQIFDDIEAPMSLNQAASRAGVYADTANGATATVAVQSSIVATGSSSGLITFNSGTGASYGGGAFLISPYSTPSLYVDAAGAVQLGFWLRSSVGGLKYRIAIQEAGSPTSPTAMAEGEAFESAIQTGGPANTWQWVELDLAPFNEDIYNPNCQPTCGASGDGIKDYQAISSVTIKVQGAQGSGSLYFDDVTFITTWKTPTPTESPTFTRTPSRSPSPSASPSFTMTGTATRTPTPSLTESPSASFTQTAMGTPSFTSTQTLVLPSATATATPTQTLVVPSATYTATPSNTVVLPSFTSTNTPLPGSTWTNTSTVSPSSTRTLTWTPSGTPTPSITTTFSSTSTQTPVLPSATSTHTPLPGSTFTGTSTVSPVNSATRTQTPNSTPSNTPVVVSSFTRTATPSVTPAATFSSTVTPNGGPGEGSATLSPIELDKGASGRTLTLVYTATNAWSNGRLQITMPAGWQAPSTTPTDAGYTTMSISGGSVGGVSLAGSVYTILVNSLPAGGTITLVYGSTGGGGPGLTVPNTVGANIFSISSDPLGAAVAPIATSPSLNVKDPVAPTWTPDTASADGPILATVPAPNPNPAGISVMLNRPVDALGLKVYTTSMMVVAESRTGPQGAGWAHVPLPTEFFKDAPSGTYYYVVTAEKNGSDSRANGTGKLMVLR